MLQLYVDLLYISGIEQTIIGVCYNDVIVGLEMLKVKNEKIRELAREIFETNPDVRFTKNSFAEQMEIALIRSEDIYWLDLKPLE